MPKTKDSQNEIEQLSLLFSDIPMEKAFPSRALSKMEICIVTAFRYAVQEKLKDGHDLSVPAQIIIDANTLGETKGLKNPRAFKEQAIETINNMQTRGAIAINMFIPSSDGDQKGIFRQISVIDTIQIDTSKGMIFAQATLGYQHYIAQQILLSPDLQFDTKFYLNITCQYSYDLSNWICARIAEIRKSTKKYDSLYNVRTSIDTLMQRVPSAKKCRDVSTYIRTVIMKAVDDINNNPYSQINILQVDKIRAGKQIAELDFLIDLSASSDPPVFITHSSDESEVDDFLIPGWEYLEQKAKGFGLDSSFVEYAQTFERRLLWRALLISMSLGKANPKYINTVFMRSYGLENLNKLLEKISLKYPYYMDGTMQSIADYCLSQNVEAKI